MLTVIHSPIKYNFSRNPQFVQVETDNFTYNVDEGTPAEAFIRNMFPTTNGLTISFVIGGGAPIVFTFQNTTNIGINQIAKYAFQGFEYLAQLCNDLMSHPSIGTDYMLTPNYNSIVMVAKQPGAAYNLTGSSSTVPGGVFVNYKSGTTNIVVRERPNYKIGIELFAETEAGSNTFEKVLDVLKEPSGGKISCDLADVINANLQYDVPTFESGETVFRCLKSCKRFYIKLAEYFGEPTTAQSTTQTGLSITGMDGVKFISEKYHVLKAGFDKISRRIISEEQFNYYATNSAFLTRQPRLKKIGATQIEWLYYLFNAAPATTARIRYRLYKRNGTMVETNAHVTDSGVLPNDVWAFPIHTASGYFTSGDDYIKIEACVIQSTGGSEMSETFTYLLDENYPLAETYLFFTNSDAGLDTLRCVGVNECKLDFERDVAERTITINDTQDDGDMLVLYAQKNNSFTVFSGWKNQAELNYIEELMLTRQAFTFGNAYGQNVKVPVIITSKQLVRNRTNKNLKGYVIEYKDALIDEISQANYYPIV